MAVIAMEILGKLRFKFIINNLGGMIPKALIKRVYFIEL